MCSGNGLTVKAIEIICACKPFSNINYLEKVSTKNPENKLEKE